MPAIPIEETTAEPEGPVRERMPRSQLEEVRRTRRHPRITQFDYLHLRRLVDDLADALRRVPGPVRDVLDVYCGARPYDDLLPSGAHSVGMDIDDHYGVADVVTSEFLPFDDKAFDLVISISAFYYVPDPEQGAAEIRRVLRPGGTVVITTPLIWEYDRSILEHRYTGPELEALFRGWDDVEIVENGSRGVSWGLLTGEMVKSVELTLPWSVRRWTRPVFMLAYCLVNAIAALGEAVDRRLPRGSMTLPPNLLLTARRPLES
jgi:SAM-dependent methyltransferase